MCRVFHLLQVKSQVRHRQRIFPYFRWKYMWRRIQLNNNTWKIMSFLPLQKKLRLRTWVWSHFQPKQPLYLSEIWKILGIELSLGSLLTMKFIMGKYFLMHLYNVQGICGKQQFCSADENVNISEKKLRFWFGFLGKQLWCLQAFSLYNSKHNSEHNCNRRQYILLWLEALRRFSYLAQPDPRPLFRVWRGMTSPLLVQHASPKHLRGWAELLPHTPLFC